MKIPHNKRYFSKKDILVESLQCRTRNEFRNRFSGAYMAATRMGVLEEVCKHMIVKNYSTPQLILKQILEHLLKSKCKYNDRKLISPYEIDVFFEDYNIAFEYNGERWHRNDVVDKKELCSQKDVLLITICENNKNYEADIKNQLVKFADTISKQTNKSIIKKHILEFSVDYGKIVPNIEDIQKICLSYNDYSVFSQEEGKILNLLRKYHLVDFTMHMKRKKKKYYDADIEQIKELTKNYTKNIASFANEYGKIYLFILRHNLEYLLEHMRETITIWNYENIVEEIEKYEYLSDFMEYSGGCYNAIKRLKLDYLLDRLKKKKKVDYTIEYCKNIISKYETVKDFMENDRTTYQYCYANDLQYLYSHLKRKHNWSEEKMAECISNCKTLKEFSIKYPEAYGTARQKYKHLLSVLKKYT